MAKLQGVKVIDMKDGEVTKVEYEGAEYSRIDVPKGGDIGLRVNNHIPRIAEVGRYYKITSKVIEEYRYVCYVDEEGDEIIPSNPDNFHYFRKVEDSTLDSRVTKLEQDVAELKGGEAGEVEQPTYKKGDKVRVVAAEGTYRKYKDGDILTVKEYSRSGRVFFVEEHDHGLLPREVEPAKPKIGDKVRVVNAFITNGEYKNGDVLTVIGFSSLGNILVKEHMISLLEFEFEIMTTAVVKAWEKEQQAEAKQDAEFAKFSEKEAVEIEKWASIGREVDEFKAGDIAEVVQSPNASPVGTLVVVAGAGESNVHAIGWSVPLGVSIGYRYKKEHLKLVTPVEQRFDRD